MNEYPIIFSGPMIKALLAGHKTQTRRLPTRMWANVASHVEAREPVRLWVRETWAPSVDSGPLWVYAADYEGWNRRDDGLPGWRSPIYMPRCASRVTLDVRSICKERLQDISEVDALAEGCRGDDWHHHPVFGICTDAGTLPSEEFRIVWNELHPDGPGWEANPEVYVIEFRRLE